MNVQVVRLYQYALSIEMGILTYNEAYSEVDYVDIVSPWTRSKSLVYLDEIDLRLN